jgi:hypothetical protein
MSFDLGVWFEPEPITDEQAADKYRKLCNTDVDSAVPAHPRVAAFYRDLTERFPDVADTGDVEAFEQSPWTAGLSTTPASVIMTISWPRAAEITAVVRQLANRHRLICHDPQTGATSHPDFTLNGHGLSLSSCNGSRSIDPTPARIEQTLRRLSVDNWFVLLERDDDHWIQVGYSEQAGTRAGWYALERRDGSAEQHYGTVVSDLHEVIKAFQQYAANDESWMRRFAWNKVEI